MSDSSENVQKTLKFFAKPLSYVKTDSDETEALTLLSKLTKPAALRIKNNTTLLHRACYNGWYKVVLDLVRKHHCDPNWSDKYGVTSIHYACAGNSLDIVKFLIKEQGCDPRCRNRYGSTPLHEACNWGRLDTVKYLVNECQCDPLVKNKYGNTPFNSACYCGHADGVAFLVSTIKTNQASDKLASGGSPLENIVLSSRRNHPLNPALKVLVLGNGDAGKTSLIKAMQNKLCATSALASFADRFRQVSDVELQTAGVIPVHIQSDKFGYFIVYDFAGQYQYYSSHVALTRKIVSSETVILLAVDVSEDKEVVIRNLNYWKTLISTLSRPGVASPDVVVVGTHADVALKQGEKLEEKMTDALKQANMSPKHFVVLNCKKLASSGLSALCNVLVQKSQSSSKQFSVDIQVHFLHALIKRELGSQVACRVSTIEDLVRKDEHRVAESNTKDENEYDEFDKVIVSAKYVTLLPHNLDTLCQHLTTLSDHGHILYLKNKHNIRDGWVIINTEVLLSEVNGTIFAPEYFKQHHDMSNNTGVVPQSKISDVFPEYNLEMIVGFLKHFEFCQEIAQSEASLISKDHSKDGNGSSEKYLLFPSLVSVERPEETCRSIEKTHHKSGWCLECVQDDQFLTSRFLHVLLLRISFTFALSHETSAEDKNCPVVQRHCNMWKSGIHWQNRDGVEAIVEVVEQNTSVPVIVGCSEGAEMACIQLRSELIEMILQIKREFCEVIDTRESIIHPVELHTYPLKSSKDLLFFSVEEITKTIAEGKHFVVRKKGSNQDREKIDSLLHFEPNSCLHPTLLTQLYAVNNVDKNVARETVDAIKTQLDSHPVAPKELLRGRVVTYGDLRTALDKYSLFRGRNILDLAGVSPAPVSEHLTEGQEEIDQHKVDWPLPPPTATTSCQASDVRNTQQVQHTERRQLLTGTTVPELTLGNLLEMLDTLTNPLDFGARLKIEQSVLRKIEKKWSYPTSIDDQNRDLCGYIENNSQSLNITWEKIAEALEKSDNGNLSVRVRESCCN